MLTVELLHPVSHLERRASPPVPSVLWKLNIAVLRGHGLEDNHPTGSDDMTSNNMLIQSEKVMTVHSQVPKYLVKYGENAPTSTALNQ